MNLVDRVRIQAGEFLFFGEFLLYGTHYNAGKCPYVSTREKNLTCHTFSHGSAGSAVTWKWENEKSAGSNPARCMHLSSTKKTNLNARVRLPGDL